MGEGSRIGQYERRFHEGEQEREREESEVFHIVKTFGEYEIREAESGGYELLKGGEVIGTFTEAEIEEDRVVFKLAYGTNLEVSEKGVREILSPAKAELCGLLASDGCVRGGKGGRYEVSLSTVDEEIVEAFKRLCEEVYGVTPHCYLKHRGGEEDSYEVGVYNKEVFYDLLDLGIKGPGHYEFHPPLEHLDEEGKKAYVRGFFSGDGTLSVYGRESIIRMSSTCKDGLAELRELLISLGFHPYEIHEDKHERERPRYIFNIPAEEHVKFIEEIGSEKEEHKDKFELVRRLREEIEERRKQK